MSRRMIDPAFWNSESLARHPIAVRYFFAGLFSNADDQGRLRGHPALLRSTIYPYDDIDLDEIEHMLRALCGDGGPVLVYEVEGKAYVQIVNWWRWQPLTWAWPSKMPPPPGWRDRLCYRRGNAVVRENWDEGATGEEGAGEDSGATVTPEWPQDEPVLGTAPRDSGSGSGDDRISGSGSGGESERPRKRARVPRQGSVEVHPAIGAYREVMHSFPDKALWQDISLTVGTTDGELERWTRICRAWLGLGWNKRNLTGLLDCFRSKRMPGNGRPGARASPAEPAGFAAIRELGEEEGWTGGNVGGGSEGGSVFGGGISAI